MYFAAYSGSLKLPYSQKASLLLSPQKKADLSKYAYNGLKYILNE
jgi:hypothetical protein